MTNAINTTAIRVLTDSELDTVAGGVLSDRKNYDPLIGCKDPPPPPPPPPAPLERMAHRLVARTSVDGRWRRYEQG
jgi:hypothetical protein